MKQNKWSSRQLKKHMLPFLKAQDFSQGLAEIRRYPPRKVVGPLFSYLCSLDEIVKWRTVTAMGTVIADLAATDDRNTVNFLRHSGTPFFNLCL